MINLSDINNIVAQSINSPIMKRSNDQKKIVDHDFFCLPLLFVIVAHKDICFNFSFNQS